jgi:hypothetical protein
MILTYFELKNINNYEEYKEASEAANWKVDDKIEKMSGF